jgi:hypothetical protein
MQSPLRGYSVSMSMLLALGGWCLWGILAAWPAEGQTFSGVQGDRTRIMLGFKVNPEIVRGWLPAPWQLDPPSDGPLQGANFIVVLVDRVLDDDSKGRPRASGTNPLIMFVAPGKHPQTGHIASVILGGFAENPASVPGFYQVYRAAIIRVEQMIKSQEGGAEEVTNIWEVREALGAKELELRLRSLRPAGARTRARGEAHVISAKDPALWRIYQFDAAIDVVKSVPDGIDRLQEYTFSLTPPEYLKLFDGSEQLIGISMTPWYVRQVFVK